MPEHSAARSIGAIKLPRLSVAASRFVQQHPDQAELAVAAALEAAAAQLGFLNRQEAPVPEALQPFIIERTSSAAQELISPEEAARRLQVSRATVYNWIESQRLIGWRLTRQGTLIPAEQIVGPGEIVSGIEQILDLLPDPRAAWRFLTEESPYFETPQRPLDVLKAGKVEEVVAAVRTAGEAFQ